MHLSLARRHFLESGAESFTYRQALNAIMYFTYSSLMLRINQIFLLGDPRLAAALARPDGAATGMADFQPFLFHFDFKFGAFVCEFLDIRRNRIL
jgi:hypothetical protein